MKAKCTQIILNEVHGDKSMSVDYSKGGMLQLGAVYVVYAISVWNGSLNYLIVPREATLPNWYPADLFDVIDQTLHVETYYDYYGKEDARGVNALWGYKEMTSEPNHYVDLIEREPKAISTFLKRKAEIDATLVEDQ